MTIRCRTVLLAALAMGAWAFSPSFAEDPERSGSAAGHDPLAEHEEMERLIGQVELRMRKMDRLLSDAGAGDTSSLERVGPSGIDELLKLSRSEARDVISDIDRILELANHQHPGGT